MFQAFVVSVIPFRAKLRDCSTKPQRIPFKSFPFNYLPLTVTLDANRNCQRHKTNNKNSNIFNRLNIMRIDVFWNRTGHSRNLMTFR